MRTAAGWAFAVLAITPTVAGAVADPAPAIDPAVAALVADLGAPDYQVREQAAAKLLAMGDKILPDLRRALAATDNPEVGRRLAVLIRRLDHDRLLSPRRVTLDLVDKPLKDVFDAIGQQTGYRVEFGGDPAAAAVRYSFAFDGVPFWEALDRVAVAAGLHIEAGYNDETVRVNGYNGVSPFVSHAGPFRVVATNIGTSRSVQLTGINPRYGGGNRPRESLNLSFQIQSEPKTPLLGARQAEVTVAEDDTGISMVPRQDPNTRTSGYYNGGYRGHNMYANLNLTRGAREATSIRTLKGRVPVALLAGVTPDIVVADPLKVKKKRFVGRSATVEVEEVTETGGGYQVLVTVARQGGRDPYDGGWQNTLWQKLELTDAAGGQYRANGYNHLNGSATAMQASVTFVPDPRAANPPKLGPPVKLVFNEWETVTQDVVFEFKDLPLP